MSWLSGKKKPSATTKFEFELEVHEVRPWLLPDPKLRDPINYVLHWERGSKRSGTGRAVASTSDGPTSGKIPFREHFRIPATLHKEHEKGSTQPTYQTKCILLSLHEAHRDGTPKGSVLGRVTLDLSDYASLAENTSASQSVPVETGKTIKKAVGTPMLALTVRHFSKSSMKERERAKSPSTTNPLSPKAPSASPNRRESLASSGGMSDSEEVNKEKLISAILSDDDDDDIDFMTEEDLKDNKPSQSPPPAENTGSVPSFYAPPDSHGLTNGKSGRGGLSETLPLAAKSSSESLDEAKPQGPSHASHESTTRHISPNRPVSSSAASIAAAAAAAYTTRTNFQNSNRSPSPLHRFQSLNRDRASRTKDREAPQDTGGDEPNVDPPPSAREQKPVLLRENEIPGSMQEAKQVWESLTGHGRITREPEAPTPTYAPSMSPTRPPKSASHEGQGEETRKSRVSLSGHGRITREQEVEPAANVPSVSPTGSHKSAAAGIYATVPRPPLSPTHGGPSNGSGFSPSPPQSPRMSHEKEYGRDVLAGDSEPVRFWGSKSRQTTPERDRSRIRDRRPTAGSVAEALARESGSGRDETTKWVGETAMRNTEHDARLAEAKSAAAAAATGLRIAEERAERAEAVVSRMQAELLDAAVADVSVHGFPAYHGDSCHSMHAPARRIARAYAHVRRTQGAARAASAAHSAASSLALATRACGNDIPRLLFWWSNCIILRELILQDQESDGFGRSTEERTPSRRVSTTLSDRRESGFLSSSERRESGLFASDRRESGLLASDRRESSYLDRRESGLLDPTEPRLSVAERIERRQSGALRSPSPLQRRSEEPAGIRMSRQTSGAGFGAKVEDCSEQTEEFMANLKHLEEFIHKKVLLTLWKEVVMPVLTGVTYANHRSSAVEPSSPRANGSNGTSPLASLRNRYFPSQESSPIQAEPVSASVSRRQSTSALGFGTAGRATSRARGSALVFPTVGEGSEIPPLSGNKPGRRYPGGTECIEAWCSTFTDMKKKLCPARALGHDCGCLFWMTKLTLEQLAQMLDVALFNAILRDLEVNESTDSITDPCTDPRVLPLTSGVLTFGGGVQLKIAVAAWTDWVTQITAMSGSPTGSQSSTSSGGSRFPPNSPNGGGFGRLSSLGTDAGDVGPLFPLLRETADLLMLPKDMLMDKSARTEIFSTLTLPLIRRVIYLFVPDENTPEPLPPSLLAAFNAEVSIENRKKGLQDMGPSSCPTAPAANTPYVSPPSNFIREIITNRAFENQDVSARGYDSDDELFLVESPLEILVKGEERPHRSPLRPGESPWSAEYLGMAAQPGRRFSLQGHDKLNANSTKEMNHLPGRFRLLQQFWGAPHPS